VSKTALDGQDTNGPAVDLRKRRVKRNALILGAVALAFYFGFIWMAVSKAG
jgi:hypothetical protein